MIFCEISCFVFNASKDEGVDVNVASDEVDSTLDEDEEDEQTGEIKEESLIK